MSAAEWAVALVTADGLVTVALLVGVYFRVRRIEAVINGGDKGAIPVLPPGAAAFAAPDDAVPETPYNPEESPHEPL